MALRFYNTRSRSLEDFTPVVPGQVRMYNCGPTVYSSPHIGNFRSFLFADVLRRLLEFEGHAVLQIMNLTDVGHLTQDDVEAGEDKMEAESRRARKTVWEIAEAYIAEFFAATKALSFRPAHRYPRATDHIPEMLAMIQKLVDTGYAYVAPTGNVYFEVGRFADYGSLSGNRGEDLQAGARIEVNPEKRDPRDFALWKIDPRHQMQWDSPWGRGFPGWHIECSAMAKKYLGETLDIHTGGEDNVFPHHECEIAQSECCNGKPFVRYWLHVRHLLVEGRKMAKREGNFITIADLQGRGYPGDAIRLALLKAHYREPLNFTFTGLDEAARKVERYGDLRHRLRAAAGDSPAAAETGLLAEARARFRAALEDDVNVSVALAALDGMVSEANRRDPGGAEAAAFLKLLEDFWNVLGLLEHESGRSLLRAADVKEEIVSASGHVLDLNELLEQRETARARRDFAESDRIRNVLRQNGFEVIDTKEGPQLRKLQG